MARPLGHNGGGESSMLKSCDRTLVRSQPSACPHEVENADQTSGFVYREYDEPEVANVRDTASWHPGRSAKHRVVWVVADPGQQRHEHVERVLRKAVHLPERAGLQVRPVLHAWGRRSRM